MSNLVDAADYGKNQVAVAETAFDAANGRDFGGSR
jgi:hypothetical protein